MAVGPSGGWPTVKMGNPRNLRRASSDDEEEGDVFDDKSEVSSGSDEEEAPRREEAIGGSPAPAEAARTSSPSGVRLEAGDSPANSSGTEAGKDAPAEAENGIYEGVAPETNAVRGRRLAPRGDGSRRKIKSTWQLMQEDPSFVPRETRYFLHDDRRDGDGEESEDADPEADSQYDTSVPRSTQTRVGPSKRLWTPDERKGVWKHDMWEQLQKEEAASRTTAYNWNRGRPSRRGSYNGYGRGGRGDSWVPRNFRGGRHGISSGYTDESWRGGWRPRARGRGQGWDAEPRRQYVPRQSAAE